MIGRIRKSLEEKEEGFTLIELLVVIIIIGILAAIAIPVFLSQRKKGYDASVKSDLRNAATAEETYLTDHNTYGATLGTSSGLTTSSNNTIMVSFTAGQGYCLVGNNTNSPGHYFLYDSQAGGLVPGNPYADATTAEGACTLTGGSAFAALS